MMSFASQYPGAALPANCARSVIQPSPMLSVMVLASHGFASSSHRRGVIPFVLVLR